MENDNSSWNEIPQQERRLKGKTPVHIQQHLQSTQKQERLLSEQLQRQHQQQLTSSEWKLLTFPFPFNYFRLRSDRRASELRHHNPALEVTKAEAATAVAAVAWG
ncbi:uncharacterized protein EMH_0030910 [Eimeria mitis]|uniref:Uncharacterized protein n=1 Tax=Eimeria mitis TaxID=44415 RepID=U6JYS4_9EIME|nr:uncharacterized protein EMH_0030910 [Eimeria mitis]CDJ30640.1 hypothetical protein EMH_0030910 [Eimeria mitis]